MQFQCQLDIGTFENSWKSAPNGALNMQHWTLQDWIIMNEFAAVDIARLDIDGPDNDGPSVSK